MKVSQLFETIRKTAGTSEKMSLMKENISDVVKQIFAYTYDKTSKQVYKTVKPKELRGLFLPYHTMDPAQAIDRILEAKELANENADEEKRQFEIYKRIRKK